MEYDEYDDLVRCPWCTNQHDIVKKRLEIHYSKLKQNNDPCVRQLRTCRYNSHHKVHKKQLDQHYAECEDAKKFTVRELLHSKEATLNGGEQQGSVGDHVLIAGDDFEEDWDRECHPTEKYQYVPESFRVPDNYHSLYDRQLEDETPSVPKKVEVDGKNPKKNLKKQGSPATVVAQKDEKDSLQNEKMRTVPVTTGSDRVQPATEDVEPLDDKKMIRKLEKKLKEIKKLEERAASSEQPNFTKAEVEKISKRNDIEKQLADLKLNL